MRALDGFKSKNTSVIFAVLATAAIFSISACSPRALSTNSNGYPDVYDKYNNAADSSSLIVNSANSSDEKNIRMRVANIINLHADLVAENLAEKIANTYSSELYFNDTLRTFTDRQQLLEYMFETVKKLDYNRVKFHEIIPSDDSYYLRWSMKTGFRVLGKMIKTDSIGMTQIKFDKDGKINFHQDFWDNTEGLFRHIPVVGFFIDKAKG